MIDYAIWDDIKEFTIEQATWIWLDQEPKLNVSDRSAAYLATNGMIYSATQSGELPSRESGGQIGSVYCFGETHIRRQDLKIFAESKGKKQKFLFPEMRFQQEQNKTESKANSKNESSLEITENERVKLLSIIGLLAEALADTNPGDLRKKTTGGIVLGNGEMGKDGKTNLLFEILKTVKGLELSNSYGLGKTTLETVIKEALIQGVNALKERK